MATAGDGTGSRRQLNEVVADRLRTEIIRGDLPPGTRLAEERLAATYGVSRNPVREAIRRLQAEGFLVIETNRGATVREVTLAEARDLMSVRAALETLVARQAAERASSVDVADLRAIVKSGMAAARRGRWEAMSELNTAFHDRLAEASGNATATEVVARLRGRLAWLYVTDDRRARQSWQEHRELVDAIARGDITGAEAVMARHLGHAEDTQQLRTASRPRGADERPA